MPSPRVFLRSTLAYDPITNHNARPQTLSAFSPDIIPIAHMNTNPDDLIRTYPHYIAHPLRPSQSNEIWVRGRALSDGDTPVEIHIHSVANELILWPQVWNKEPPLGQLSLNPQQTGSVDASQHPLIYNPPQGLGRHETFIATTRENSATAFPDVKNWRELTSTIGNDDSLAFYNVVTVDPTSPVISLTTRLRIYDNEMESVSLEIGIQSIGIPTTGLEAAFFGLDNQGRPNNISFPRGALSPTVHTSVPVTLPAGFDGFIYLHIYNDNRVVVADHASVSLVVTGRTRHNDIPVIVLVGAEHVVFDSSTRVISYLEKLNSTKQTPKFYFRTRITDDHVFPRLGNSSTSPDIQPFGPVGANNPKTYFADFQVDSTSKNSVLVKPGQSNYIYARATTTAVAPGRIRLFAVPSGLLLFPAYYSQYPVTDIINNNKVPAIRSFPSDVGPVVVEQPFNLANPRPPGEVNPGSDHYCLIAEYLATGDSELNWPHNALLQTGGEFTTWVLSEPRVAWRNVIYSFNSDGATSLTQTSFAIPDGYPSNTLWRLELVCDKIPIDSSVEMTAHSTSTNPGRPPVLNIGRTTVTNSQQIFSVPFTGVNPGFACTVTMSWFKEGKPLVPGQTLSVGIVEVVPLTSVLAKAFGVPPSKTETVYPLVVFPDYPGIKNHFSRGDEVSFVGLRGAIDILPKVGKAKDNPYSLSSGFTKLRTLGRDSMRHGG